MKEQDNQISPKMKVKRFKQLFDKMDLDEDNLMDEKI